MVEKSEEEKKKEEMLEECKVFIKAWQEDMQEKVIDKMEKEKLNEFMESEAKTFFETCSQEAQDSYMMPHDLTTFKEVTNSCNEGHELTPLRLLDWVPIHYNGGEGDKYFCLACGDEKTVKTDLIWRCDNQYCFLDICQTCWNKKVLTEFFKLKRTHAEEKEKVLKEEKE